MWPQKGREDITNQSVVRESNIMKICKGMDVTPFELFQTDKKVLVINDPIDNLEMENWLVQEKQ